MRIDCLIVASGYPRSHRNLEGYVGKVTGADSNNEVFPITGIHNRSNPFLTLRS